MRKYFKFTDRRWSIDLAVVHLETFLEHLFASEEKEKFSDALLMLKRDVALLVHGCFYSFDYGATIFRLASKRNAIIHTVSSSFEGDILLATRQILKNSKRMCGVPETMNFHRYLNELAKRGVFWTSIFSFDPSLACLIKLT